MKKIFGWFKTNELFRNFNMFLLVISILYAFSIQYKIDSVFEFILVVLMILLYNNMLMIPAYIANTKSLNSEDVVIISTIIIMIVSDYMYYLAIFAWFVILFYVLFYDYINIFDKKDKK